MQPLLRLQSLAPRSRRQRCGAAACALSLLALLLGYDWTAAPLPPVDSRQRLVAHLRARHLLLHRSGRRLVFVAPSLPARERLCALAAQAGELLDGTQCPRHAGAAAGVPGGSDAADAASACRRLRGSPYTALLLAQLPDPPHWDARAVYLAVLVAPREHRSWAAAGVARLLGRRDEAPSLRALGGAAARSRPRGQLGADDLGAAQAALTAMDAVLLLSSASDAALRAALAGVASLTAWTASETAPPVLPAEAVRLPAGLDTHETALLAAAAGRAAQPPRPGVREGRSCSELSGASLPPLPVPPGAGADAPGGCDTPTVAICAAVRDGAPFLSEWLAFHAAAGVTRAYLHDDGSADATASLLAAWASPAARGFVTALAPLHGPPRHGINQRSGAGGWSGQREVLGRCLTHAVLDNMCWLLNPDLDEFFVPKPPMAALPAALATLAQRQPGLLCATVRRHAFNSNNASAAVGLRDRSGEAWPEELWPTSALLRTYQRRSPRFPPDPAARGTPRNPKWALRVPAAAAALREEGPHAVALQVHNIWDRASCDRCQPLPALLASGTTPEVDPCAGWYARPENKGPSERCARNVCALPGLGALGEAQLKLHHYVLPAKSYRRGGGDAGGRRDVWAGDVLDGDALPFAPP